MEKKTKIEEPTPYQTLFWSGVEKRTGKIIIVSTIVVLALFVGIGTLTETIRPKRSTTLLFVGDIMLDRGVRNAINREGPEYPFGQLRELLTSADVSIGNLEGVFTDNPSISVVDNSVLRFTFDPTLVTMLREFGFTGFSLANNHAWDFGREGFDNTKRLLAENGMFSFGSPVNDLSLSAVHPVGEEKLCFVGYHSLYREDPSSVLAEIGTLRPACDFLTVVAHWGAEYTDMENESQRRLGRSFVDAGADLVIGHHPHVVQPIEIYKGRAIFYSLGNFLFDQDFSVATRQGLAIRLTLSEDRQDFHLIPIEMSRARLYYPEHEAYQARKDILVSKLPEPLKTHAIEDSVFSLSRVD